MEAAPAAVMLIMEVGVKQISIAGKMLEKLGKNIYPRDAKFFVYKEVTIQCSS